MNRIIIIALLIIGGNCLQAQDARLISEKAMDVMEVGSMEMTATLQIIDAKGRERVRQLTTSSKTFDGVSKTMLKFNAPADVKGTSLLIFDHEDKADDMWIYLPALRKTRRIVSSEKGKSFMGSEFTNADMTIPNTDDFEYSILGEEQFNDEACWKIESKCKNEDIEDENGYSRRVSWIDKETHLCYKVEFYNFDDELNKVQTISDYRKQDQGTFFAYFMEMRNVRNQRKSIMTVDSFKTGIDINEQAFSPAMMKN